MNLRFFHISFRKKFLEAEKMKTNSHLKLRALCEGAIFVALAQVISYLKFFELPQGGSITVGMLPIFLFCAR